MNQIVRFITYALLGIYVAVALHIIEQRRFAAMEAEIVAADDARELAQQ